MLGKLNINESFICKIWEYDFILTPNPSPKRRGEQFSRILLYPLLIKEGVGGGLG